MSELVRVSGPALPVVILMSAPAPVATVHLRRPLADGDDAEAIRRRMYSLTGHVNAMEAEEQRAGLSLDEARSGIRAGEVVLVLVPNDPADALATCKRVANILFNAARGVTVKVFAADQPNAPVYELAV